MDATDVAKAMSVKKEHNELKKEGRTKISFCAFCPFFAAIPSLVLIFARFVSLREIFFGAISHL
jgi:hypothetical protein